MTQDTSTSAKELFDLDPDRVRCPYPVFAEMRSVGPVTWFDDIDSYVVTSYDLIVEVLKQPDKFSSRYATGRATQQRLAEVMIELIGEDPEMAALAERRMTSGSVPVLLSADPPAHPRQRALVNRAFSPPAIRRLEPEIDALAHQLVDDFADRGRVELVSEFAGPFPMIVIAKALGVGLDRMDDFTRWSHTVVAGIGNPTIGKAELSEIVRAQTELADYLLGVVLERQEQPEDDLISQIVESTIDGERLTPVEVVDMSVQFLLAGNDTTAKLIATSMLRLAQDPALADELRSDPDRLVPFVEEMLRVEPPINGTYRIADVAYELGGVEVPAGSSLWLVYASGNRDPAHFPEPDACRFAREAGAPHLAFGFGAHFCLGASLARAEARLGLQTLLARCRDIRLDGDLDAVVYDRSFMLHGLQQLPLAFEPVGPV